METESGTVLSLETMSGGLASSRPGERAGGASFSPMWRLGGASHLALPVRSRGSQTGASTHQDG